jgi:branched-chain amino acid transport system permease protein
MDFFLQMLLTGIMTGAVYVLMAISVVIVYKSSSIFNFAHGALVALTAYLSWSFMVQLHLPIWLGFLCLLAVVFLLGWLIQRLILQPLTGQPVLAAVMATIALGEVLSGFITLVWPGPGRNFPEIIPSEVIHLGEVILAYESLINFIISGLAFGIFMWFFHRTRMGLAMRGTAEDHQLARSEGIKVTRIFSMSWIIAIIMAAVGGILMGNLQGVDAFPLSSLGMKSLAVVILGGMESIGGAVIAGLIIGIAEVIGAGYLDPYVGGGTQDVFPFVILIIVLMIRPYGLFGYERIERV